jgi:hypothetical protein
MMIILFDAMQGELEWFDERHASNVVDQWKYTDDEDNVDELFLTVKTNQFILQETYAHQHKSSTKKTPKEALVWLIEHEFCIPDMLMKYLTEDNKI